MKATHEVINKKKRRQSNKKNVNEIQMRKVRKNNKKQQKKWRKSIGIGKIDKKKDKNAIKQACRHKIEKRIV